MASSHDATTPTAPTTPSRRISTSRKPATRKMASSHDATTPTAPTTPMSDTVTSNSMSMITGTVNNALQFSPHFIVIYILIFLLCCFIVIVIIFVSKFNVSVKKRLLRLENPIFTGTRSITQQQLDMFERRLRILENSPFIQTESRSSTRMETENDYLSSPQRLESHTNLSWDMYDVYDYNNYEPVYNTTTTRF
jgi:hypothetical protein